MRKNSSGQVLLAYTLFVIFAFFTFVGMVCIIYQGNSKGEELGFYVMVGICYPLCFYLFLLARKFHKKAKDEQRLTGKKQNNMKTLFYFFLLVSTWGIVKQVSIKPDNVHDEGFLGAVIALWLLTGLFYYLGRRVDNKRKEQEERKDLSSKPPER